MKTGIEIIAEERKRQVEIEDFHAAHDAEHNNEDLAFAAMCYAMPQVQREEEGVEQLVPHDYWPWNPIWWKPTPENRIKELAKAGALIAAEIDRINNL